MNHADQPSTDGRGRPARRRGWPAVALALVAAFAFGAIDQSVGAASSPFLTQVSGMSAPWLLVPFLAGAWQIGERRAAVTGLAASWLAVLAWVLMIISPMEGTHLGPRPPHTIGSWNQLTVHLLLTTLASQWAWFAAGALAGPLYGWLGYRWRARHSWSVALVAALPVLLEPVLRWLVTHAGVPQILAFGWPGYPAAVLAEIAEVAAGLLLTALVVTAIARTRAPGPTGPGRA